MSSMLNVSIFLTGYRDAQCGWMSSEEICHSDKPTWDESSFQRTVTFLVIYISKRGILEIWTPLQGVRVAAFNCCKWAKYFVGLSLIFISIFNEVKPKAIFFLDLSISAR